jgi:hypothetical protein
MLKNSIHQKALSILLAFSMVLSVFQFAGVPAFAEDGGSLDSGDGSPENPYLISTAAQLQNVNNNLDACYRLTKNIIFDSGAPIGADDATPFTGTFDGGGHTVTVNIKFNAKFAGLFGFIGSKNSDGTGNGTVENLHVAGSVKDSGTDNHVYVGGLAGENCHGTITNCSSACTVTGTAFAAAKSDYRRACGLCPRRHCHKLFRNRRGNGHRVAGKR